MFKYSAIFILILFILLSGYADNAMGRQRRIAARYSHSSLDFHFGVWDSADSGLGIETYYTYDSRMRKKSSDVSVSGIGGFLAYTHQINRRFSWEFAIGGFTQAEIITSRPINDIHRYQDYKLIFSKTHQVTLLPISFSAFFYPFAIDSSLRPYIGGGIGPYWGVESISEEYYSGEFEPIDVNILIALGRFIGGGVDLFLGKHFGFNIDFRYQKVIFHKQIGGMRNHSGPQLTWGFKVAF
jgi:outer membrane protein W